MLALMIGYVYTSASIDRLIDFSAEYRLTCELFCKKSLNNGTVNNKQKLRRHSPAEPD
jgi:hypothetical protein